MANTNLQAAKAAKKDEFYTQLTDIEDELGHYEQHFRNKTVLCNCDDPRVSNFYRYFKQSFKHLGLKRLICTCYKNQDVDLFSQHTAEAAVYIDYTGGEENILPLKGDGDFRSQECIELLKQADIVVTNPPFSLFREYVAQLMKYEKKFVIIGSINAITYKEFFANIKDNKAWLGVSIHSGDREFQIPDDYITESPSLRIDNEGKKYVRVPGIRWFTNLDNDQRHKPLIMYKHFNTENYPYYDNFDGIDVSKVSEIPDDFFGIMGVPVNFMDTYCPDQFEIIGYGKGDTAKMAGVKKNYRGRTDLSFTRNGKIQCPYGRILIRRKQ